MVRETRDVLDKALIAAEQALINDLPPGRVWKRMLRISAAFNAIYKTLQKLDAALVNLR